MKRVILPLAVLAIMATACQKYDDADISNRITNAENEQTELDKELSALEDAIEALTTAHNANDAVTGVEPIMDGDNIVGYTISFLKADDIELRHGIDGIDGADGISNVVVVDQTNDNITITVGSQEFTFNRATEQANMAIANADGSPIENVATLTQQNNTLTITGIPAGYEYLSARVVAGDGNTGAGYITRAAAQQWDVTITANGASEATITITPPETLPKGNLTQNCNIELTASSSTGKRTVAKANFEYLYPMPIDEVSDRNYPQGNAWYISGDGSTEGVSNALQIFYFIRESVSIILYDVTSLDDNAFEHSMLLSSAYLPKVQTVGVRAFAYCDMLVSLTLATETTLSSIASDAFEGVITTNVDLTIGALNSSMVDGNTLSVDGNTFTFKSITIQ